MEQGAKVENRSFYITFLTVLSCVAVVILHDNGVFWNFSYERTWLTANLLESVFYFAVPVFFMISGATLLDYRDRYDTRTYVRKRVKKTVIPFLVWSMIALIFQCLIGQYSLEGVTAYSLIDGILNARFWKVYWFFMPLYSIYLAIPVLSLIPKDHRKRIFQYIIVVGYTLNDLIPSLSRMFPDFIPINRELSFPISMGNLIFILVGYYIYQFNIVPWLRKVIYVMGAMGLVAHIVGTWYCSYQAGEIIDLFKGYTNWPCMMYSVAIFLFCRNFNFQRLGNKVLKVVNYLSTETFNVYLTHMFLLTVAFTLLDGAWTSIYFRTVGAVAVFLVCTVVSKYAKKVPVIRCLLS